MYNDSVKYKNTSEALLSLPKERKKKIKNIQEK